MVKNYSIPVKFLIFNKFNFCYKLIKGVNLNYKMATYECFLLSLILEVVEDISDFFYFSESAFGFPETENNLDFRD